MVVNLQPLAEMRGRYLAAIAESQGCEGNARCSGVRVPTHGYAVPRRPQRVGAGGENR